MIFGTPASRASCRAVAAESGDTILLGFSRGKDSIAAWLWLLEFFPRVIPFHCAAVPGLGVVERSLAYYERRFGTRIERYVAGEPIAAWRDLVYQPVEDEDWIDAMELPAVTMHDVADDMRDRYDCPRAWCAFGISKSDSIVRRSAVKYRNGRHDPTRSLYPCFDWPKAQILSAVEGEQISLPEDYRLSNRSIAGVPSVRWLERMREVYPDDFARVKLFYPLVEAALARNEFRRMREESARRADPTAQASPDRGTDPTEAGGLP